MIRRASLTACLVVGIVSAAAAPVAADSSFAGLVDGCPLIVLARVAVASDNSVSLYVERVLKGHAPAILHFPPSAPAVQPGWTRAVVAFQEPWTIASGVTDAWQVTDSGAVDPERVDQLPGTPQTLKAMLAWFGSLPATDTAAAERPPSGSGPQLALMAVASLLAFSGTTAFYCRWRSIGWVAGENLSDRKAT